MIIGCAGGGSNLGGLISPFAGEILRGEADYKLIAVEPASCPSLTRGVYAYDFCDTGKVLNISTLVVDFSIETSFFIYEPNVISISFVGLVAIFHASQTIYAAPAQLKRCTAAGSILSLIHIFDNRLNRQVITGRVDKTEFAWRP